MGIFRYFRYLTLNYPDIYQTYKVPRPNYNRNNQQSYSTQIQEQTQSQVDSTCDILLLDANAIFHTVAQEVFEYGDKTKIKVSFFEQKKKKEMTPEELNVYYFKKITYFIEKLIKISNPTKCIYVAIDGVAGSSKNSQQRQRRFKSSQSGGTSGVGNVGNFNPIFLSVGTEFMDKLCDYLNTYFSRFKKPNLQFKIIFSPVNVPGEGEHKLIRYLEGEGKHFKTIHIYSPDADLIMLSMTLLTKSNNRKVTVVRENVFRDIDADFLLVNINKLKEIIVLKTQSQNIEYPYDENKIIRDYVFYCYLLGNDFLPHPYSLDISNKGIEILYNVYTNVYTEKGYLISDAVHNPTSERKYNKEISKISEKSRLEKRTLELNYSSFLYMIQQLKELEIDMIITKSGLKTVKSDSLLLNHIKYVEKSGTHEKIKSLDFVNFRKEYYKKKFNIDYTLDSDTESNSTNKVFKICEEYVRGLCFVLLYYFKEIPTFDYCYEYHYAPLFCDLYDYLKEKYQVSEISRENELTGTFPVSGESKKISDQFSFKYNPPLNVYESLASVIPPSQFYLLPESVANYIKKKILLDADFIESFEIDLEGKQYEYEGIALIPFVSYSKIKKIFKGIKYINWQQDKLNNTNVYYY